MSSSNGALHQDGVRAPSLGIRCQLLVNAALALDRAEDMLLPMQAMTPEQLSQKNAADKDHMAAMGALNEDHSGAYSIGEGVVVAPGGGVAGGAGDAGSEGARGAEDAPVAQ